MTTSEKQITKNVIRELRRRGYWVVKMHGSAWMPAGLPDVWAVKEGRLYCFEVKKPGEKPTKLQEVKMAALRRAGVPCRVVTSTDEL